jgi:hypothetical protein
LHLAHYSAAGRREPWLLRQSIHFSTVMPQARASSPAVAGSG